jgi:peroxiredoxin
MALRALHKRQVMITFFKSWSEPCRHELARLQERQEELAAEGWVVLAVSDGETRGAAERVVEELGLRFRVLADPNRQIAREYGVRAWPMTVMIDAQGIVRQVRTGAQATAGLADHNAQ